MNKLLAVFVLACLIFARPVPAAERRGADAVGVFHCTFGDDWDVNYDRWPDRWVRKTGSNYPHYVDIEIDDDATVGKCLRFDLDGAGAAISSPPIRVMSRFRYKLEAKLKNERLSRSTVVITLDFYDAAGKLLQTEKSKPIATTDGWTQIELHEIEPKHSAIVRAVVGLEVLRGAKGDLQGQVRLGEVWLKRLPRISVTTNNPFNVYTSLRNIVVKCELSGIRERNPEIRFQLLDSANQPLDSGSFPFDGKLIRETADQDASVVEAAGKTPAVYEGSTEWKPKIPGFGYYRVVVKMLRSESADNATEVDRQLDSGHEIWLAVVPPIEGLETPSHGEFGWSLPKGDDPLSLDNLSRLLPQVGINWVKLPVWYDPSNPRRGDEFVRFVELLGASNIEVVGVIDRPPPGTELGDRAGPDAAVADVLSPETADAWSASLEPVMTRLSLRIRWWQLGRDFDTSFANLPDANKALNQLRTQLFRFGQDVRIGLCWDWESENQARGNVAWDYQQLCLAAEPSPAKLAGLLAKKRENSALRWVLVEPPSRAEMNSNESGPIAAEQYREFVMKLVSAKVHGADAIIVPNPFNDTNGLMRANGMPAELLLPWRTTATMLGGAKFLGSIQLPGGSENRIFIRPDNQVVMVVWNDKPTQEILYLGKKVRQFDIFGNLIATQMGQDQQIIEAVPDPKFVLGLHEAITRLRMNLAFEHQQVPSIYSKPHPNSLKFQNYFSQGAGGTLSIVVPKGESDDSIDSEREAGELAGAASDPWTIDPPQGTFKFARGEDAQFPFQIRLKNAMFGKQPIRIEFNLEADEHYHFSVYRELEVGTGDLTVRVRTYLDEKGKLIVEQLMTNHTKNLADFKCYLYATGERRQRMQVYRLGPAVDKKIYSFPNGAELIDKKMLLEIEELNGERVVRYPFVVKDMPEEDSEETGKAAAARAAVNSRDADASLPSLPAAHAPSE